MTARRRLRRFQHWSRQHDDASRASRTSSQQALTCEQVRVGNYVIPYRIESYSIMLGNSNRIVRRYNKTSHAFHKLFPQHNASLDIR